LKISIITINKDNCQGLIKTSESVLSQGYKNFEYIVIDGNSSDGSRNYIESISDKINYWVSEPDTGIYPAMNKGIAVAQGDYLLFLNSADSLHKVSTLEEIDQHFDGTDLIVGVTNYLRTNGQSYLSEFTNNMNYLIKASLPHQSTFIRRELLLDGYDEALSICADWKFFLEAICIKKCSVKAISDIVTQFDATGISSDPKNYERIDEEKTEVLWDLFRYDFKEWRIDDTRKKTADYYESLVVMKLYFKLNSLFRKLRT
jgi:glycosyltransferase involved in cell wall biosynthesis